MKRLLVTAFPVLMLPLFCPAQSALSGTWKPDLKQMDFSKKPDVFLLAGGMYECSTCVPPVKVKADGTDQPLRGSPYIDTVAIKVVNDREIKETDKKNGKLLATQTTTISADGKTMLFEFSDATASNGGPPVTGKGSETRVAKGPAGSHAVSGSWRMASLENISDNGALYTFELNGKELTLKETTGANYTATLDGTEAPVKGDPGLTTVSVRMIGKNTLEETYKRGGKVVRVYKSTPSADGKTLRVVGTDLEANRTTEFTATKQ